MSRLGVSPREFWTMSPAAFFLALKEYTRAERHADYRAGVLAELLFNANRAKGVAPRGRESWFPSLEPEPQTSEQVYAVFRAWSKGHNARVAEA